MNEKNNKPWFPAKNYGVGWGLPVTWQGWVVLIVYLLLLFVGLHVFTTSPEWTPCFVIYVLVLTGLLILVCWKKGEKIQFRWGKNK